MSVNLSPVAGAAAQFLDNSGNVLTGGKLHTYLAGTTTPAATYTSSLGVTFHSNPIILDAAGRVPAGGEIWLADNVSYKFVLKDANDVLIGTWDNLVGINSNFVNYTVQEEIQTAAAGQTVFTLATVTYAPGTNSLTVYVDGVNQYDGISYAFVETNANTVTFTSGLHVGALVKFTTAVQTTGNATNAAIVVYDPAGTGAVSTTVQAKLRQTVSVQDFGAVGDGVANDTTAIQNALNSGAKKVYFPAGTYKVTDELTSNSVSIFGDGPLASIITANGDTSGAYTNDGVVVLKGSVPTAISDLSISPSAGARTLTFTFAHGLSANDLILIYNPTDSSFNAARTYYRAGEYAVVANVDSPTQVTLTAPLYAGYTAANVDIYKCTGYSTSSISDVSVIAPGGATKGSVNAIKLVNCVNSSINNVVASNSDDATVAISQSYNIDISNVNFSQITNVNSFGTNYGLVIGNTQNARISGDFTGYRHAITMGGGNTFSVPNRAIIVHDFTAEGMRPSLPTIDWHGNCEYCIYTDGVVRGNGVTVGGNNNKFLNSHVIGTGYLLYGSEMLGTSFEFANLDITTTVNDAARGVIDFGGNSSAFDANTLFGGALMFSNIKINAANQTGQSFLVRNRGASVSYDVIIDNCYFNLPASASSVPTIATVSGNAPVRVQSTNVTCIGSSGLASSLSLAGVGDSSALVRQTGLTGKASITTNTGVNFIDSTVTFARPFSKAPIVVVSTDISNTSADRCGSFVVSASTSATTVELRRVDQTGANFTGAVSGYIYWNAQLTEF